MFPTERTGSCGMKCFCSDVKLSYLKSSIMNKCRSQRGPHVSWTARARLKSSLGFVKIKQQIRIDLAWRRISTRSNLDWNRARYDVSLLENTSIIPNTIKQNSKNPIILQSFLLESNHRRVIGGKQN